MNSFDNLLVVDSNIASNLGLKQGDSGLKRQNMTEEILQIFREARKAGKTELSLEEITIAYFNMFSRLRNEHTDIKEYKNKKDIALKLFYMRKIKNAEEVVALVPRKRGYYYLKKLG